MTSMMGGEYIREYAQVDFMEKKSQVIGNIKLFITVTDPALATHRYQLDKFCDVPCNIEFW